MEQDQVQDTPITEEIQSDYRIWKKNASFLYDYLSTNSLLWPSLTVQFFPDITHKHEDRFDLQRLLIGTFTLGQSIDAISILQAPIATNLKTDINLKKINFNNDKQEIELTNVNNPKLKVLQKINHDGDVNKVKYMPQKPNVLASSNNRGKLVIYERTKHSNFNKDLINNQMNKIQIDLCNDKVQSNVDIFALDWNRHKEGLLISGNTNGLINLYDITKYVSETLNQMDYWQQSQGINDIEWLPTHDKLFCTLGDTDFEVFDIRSDQPSCKSETIGGNSIAMNPTFATGFAIGDSLGYIKNYDLRQMSTPITQFQPHNDSITQVKWHPKFHNILGSSSSDHSVKIHNCSNEQDPTIFQHLGHMLGVNDFDWSLADDWLLASVGDDNSLHLWKPSSLITQNIY